MDHLKKSLIIKLYISFKRFRLTREILLMENHVIFRKRFKNQLFSLFPFDGFFALRMGQIM